MLIIDAHCHAGIGDRLTAPWDTVAPIDDYLRRARAVGIAKTVVVPAFHSDNAAGNASLARVVARHPDRLIGFAMVHARRDRGRILPLVTHCVRRYGFRGIKVHGHDALPTREVCDTARRLRLPILVDVAGKAEAVDMFAEQYPDVTFIVAHLGSFVDDWRAQRQVVEQMARYPNVYGDTSGVRRFEYLEKAIERAGPRKLIFGSDGPWLHPGAELCKLRFLGLSPEDAALVFGGNIARILSSSRYPITLWKVAQPRGNYRKIVHNGMRPAPGANRRFGVAM